MSQLEKNETRNSNREEKKPFHHSNLDHLSCYVVPSNVIDYKFHWNRKSRFLVYYKKAERNHSSLNRGMAELLFYYIDKAKPMNLTWRLIHNASLYNISYVAQYLSAAPNVSYNPIKLRFSSVFHQKMYSFLMCYVSPPFSVHTTWCWPVRCCGRTSIRSAPESFQNMYRKTLKGW